MRPRVSLSGLGLVATCPGSASLPHARTRSAPADFGNAAHALIAERVNARSISHVAPVCSAVDVAREHGLEEADAGRLAFLAKHLRLEVPSCALAEVPLGLWPDGSVRRVRGGQGRYEDDGQILSGTVDAMWAEPGGIVEIDDSGKALVVDYASTLWVVDWKTGDDEYVAPVSRNWQIRAAALLAARWTGAKRVVPALVYVNPAECSEWLREHPGEPYPGRWEVGAELNEAALAGIEADVRRVLGAAGIGGDRDSDPGRVQLLSLGAEDGSDGSGGLSGNLRGVRAGGAQDLGRDPSLVTGAHCAHCNASAACPALARQAMTLIQSNDGLVSADTAARLAGMLGPARKVLDEVETAVRAYVKAHGPIAVDDDHVYGPETEPREKLNAAAVAGALEAAGVSPWKALKATKEGVREALKGAPRGTFGKVLDAVREAGGVEEVGSEVWRVRQRR